MVIKVWLRQPRFAFRNNGGPVPRGFRSGVEWTGIKRRKLVTRNSSRETARRGDWVVNVGGVFYIFSPAEMRRLYSRVPL